MLKLVALLFSLVAVSVAEPQQPFQFPLAGNGFYPYPYHPAYQRYGPASYYTGYPEDYYYYGHYYAPSSMNNWNRFRQYPLIGLLRGDNQRQQVPFQIAPISFFRQTVEALTKQQNEDTECDEPDSPPVEKPMTE